MIASLAHQAMAGCAAPDDEATQFDASRAVVNADVISSECFATETGAIRTRYVLRVVESFKGDAPETFELTSPGGKIGGQATYDSSSLRLKPGKAYVLLLDRQPDGTWTGAPHQAFHASGKPEIAKYFRGHARGARPKLTTATSPEAEGPADTSTGSGTSGVPGSVVTATGYIQDSNGDPARFTSCDGGEPISYVVDVDSSKLPSGMDQAAALAAVQEALNAWSETSSARFRLAGIQSFGVASGSIAANDQLLRIQLHDTFNFITSSSVMGVGGGNASIDANIFFGGQLGSQGFQERRSAYIVLNHRAAFMANAANFKQVLTHELGHALGLAHSSENTSEPDAVLKNATMYYKASNDGRGAAITVYDQDRILFGYPTANLPPYTVDRLIPAVCTSALYGTLPATPGCNQIRLKAVDRENSALTPILVSSSSTAGNFSLSGAVLSFTPNALYSDATLTILQIATGYNYGKAIVQFSDGTNRSRAAVCNISSMYSDTAPSDGLPDSWMLANFSNKTPGALGSGRHPDDDPDKDGLTNRNEFYLGTNPKSAASGPLLVTYNHPTRELSFTPQRFAPYVIEASSSLTSGWAPRRVLTRYDSSAGALNSVVSSAPGPAKEYYRVVTGP